MTAWTWPTCCTPIEAHGRVGPRRGRGIVILLHAVSCDQPTERRKAVGPISASEIR